MLLDDAYMPPVAMLVDALRKQPGWEFEGNARYRTAINPQDDRRDPVLGLGGRAHRRAHELPYCRPASARVAAARHRFFSTRAGLAIVGLVRRRSNLPVEADGLVMQRAHVAPRVDQAARA